MKKLPSQDRNNKWLSFCIVFLLSTTLVLIIIQNFFLERVLTISGLQPYATWVYDDRDLGGASIGTFEKKGDGVMQMNCNYSYQYQWPFCGFSIELAVAPNGIDLSRFDQIELDIETSGPADTAVRIYLNNYNPTYSKLNDVSTYKKNEIVYIPGKSKSPFSLDLENFRPSSWWIKSLGLPPEQAGTEISNVIVLDITTMDNLAAGMHTIRVKSIKFKGVWVPLHQVLYFIISLWVIMASFYLFLTIRRTQVLIMGYNRQTRELENVNAALHLERRELKKLATRDPLTNVYNRVGLRDYLYDKLTNKSEKDVPLTVIFMDLDSFKQINDRYGHNTGDDVLVEFAQHVSNNIRANDFFGRWGGEEFILLLHHTALKDAINIAEKIRTSVKHKKWPENIQLSCSFGVAQRNPNENVSEFIKRADTALYEAKALGRDCVSVAIDHNEVEDNKVIPLHS